MCTRFRAVLAAAFIWLFLPAAGSTLLSKDKEPPPPLRYAAWKGVDSFTAEATASDHWWVNESDQSGFEDTASLVALKYRFDLKIAGTGASSATQQSVTWKVENCRALGEEDYHSRGGTRWRKSNHWHKATIDGPVLKGGSLTMDAGTGEWLVITPGSMDKPFKETGHYHVELSTNSWRPDDSPIDQPSDKIPGIFIRGKLNEAVKPGVLTGTGVVDLPTRGHPGRGSVRTYRVVMWPNYRDVECVVEIKKYEDWLPAANLALPHLPGSRLNIKATVRPKDGGPKLALRARRFRFELAGASHEPGVAMNFPRLTARGDGAPSDDPHPDLKLALNGPIGELSAKDQKAFVAAAPDEQGQDSAQVFVDAYDFGGYANLQVVCELDDDREIPGLLQSTDGPTADITVPKRSNGSKIAEVWRKKYKLGPNDAEDADATPVGDGNLGDGFSNYEEYRGLVVNGKHLRTAPGVKDIFIRNKIGPAAQFGLFVFGDVTGLAVHHKCLESEMPPSRIMNANRSVKSPRSSQESQHGLVLVYQTTGDFSYAATTGKLFRPKYVDEVHILKRVAMPDGKTLKRDDDEDRELASTIAHELCHAIGVNHHGETDLHYVAWLRVERKVEDKTESWFEEREVTWNEARHKYLGSQIPGDQIRIFSSPNVEILADHPGEFATPQTVYVGVYGGEHSGSDECIMRYDCATAYILPARPRVRYLSPGEPCGLGLCDSKTGVGINDPAKAKPPRYSDATVGDCKHQFAVRDDAPDRSAGQKAK